MFWIGFAAGLGCLTAFEGLLIFVLCKLKPLKGTGFVIFPEK